MAGRVYDYVSYRWYIPSIYLSYDTLLALDVYLVYTCHMTCSLKLGAPACSRIALEMQRHTGFGLQGYLLFSTQCGWATGPGPQRTQVTKLRRRRRGQGWGCAAAADGSGCAAAAKIHKEKIVLGEKTNMRNHMQMKGVKKGAPGIRGRMWG